MLKRICLLLSMLLAWTMTLAGFAEGAACKHNNARWVQWDATYKTVDSQQHWRYPQLGNELYCPDCKHYISVNEMDAQSVYAEAKDVMEDARALMKAMADAGIRESDLSEGEWRAVLLMQEMLEQYDAGPEAFMKWMASESHSMAGEPVLENHSFDPNGKCACGYKLYAQSGHVVSGSEKLKMNVGETLQISLKDTMPKSWKTNNAKVVKLSKDGRIKALKEGKATVTITLKNKKKWKLTITVVNPNKPTGIFFADRGPLTLKKGQSLRLKAELAPSSAITTLSWKSSKSKVVSVDKNGTITAKKAGTAKITVKTSNGLKATITVKVK